MPGVLGLIGEPNPEAQLETTTGMVQALQHEPWYQHCLVQGAGWALGRVSTGLVDDPRLQPLWNERGTRCIVMEGELFNRDDLRKLAAGSDWAEGTPDAQIVLDLFEACGVDFVRQLNGAFVFAIWDHQERRLVLVNDHLGLLPVYYAQYGGRFSFGAGVRALLADAELPRDVDFLTIAQMLSFEHALGDRTLLTAVKLLPPATILTYDDGDVTMCAYWTLAYEDRVQAPDETAYLEQFRFYLAQAVRRRKSDELPAGILLSGGLDSRVLLGFLAREHGEQFYSFTFGIPGCDDARFARELARKSGIRHRFYELQPDYLLQYAEQGVALVDGLESCTHMHALATLKEEVSQARVLFKGYLGDALVGGHLQRALWAGYDDAVLDRYLFQKYCVLLPEEDQEALFSNAFQEALGGALFPSFRETVHESSSALPANRQDHWDIIQRQRRFTLNGVELVRSQAVVRLPFSDKDLVEFMLTVPPGLRFERLVMKGLLALDFPELAKVPRTPDGLPLMPCRRDLRIRASHLVRWRLRQAGLKWVKPPRKKPYADYSQWLRSALRPWVEHVLLDRKSLQRGYFRADAIGRLVSEHMNGADHTGTLGVLLTLELWHRQFMDTPQ